MSVNIEESGSDDDLELDPQLHGHEPVEVTLPAPANDENETE